MDFAQQLPPQSHYTSASYTLPPPPPLDFKSAQTSFAPPPSCSAPRTFPSTQLTQAQKAEAEAAAKAKRKQRIQTGLKVGKIAMRGLAIGAALASIASGSGGDFPSFDFDLDFGDTDMPDVPDTSDVSDMQGGQDVGGVPDVSAIMPTADGDPSAFWQPLQDCASMPIG